jgi:hypothetical protein
LALSAGATAIFNTALAADPPVDTAVIERMSAAAEGFLAALQPELRERATFAMSDEERKRWSNLPWTLFERLGVSLEEMSPEQRILAHKLIESPLSSQGYLKTTGIMRVDEILNRLSRAKAPDGQPMFGQGFYWVGIFGDPTSDKAWGWQLDGHHLALNFTVVGDAMGVTPIFMGSDPAEIRTGPEAGFYVQGEEDRKGRALFASLSEEQRAKAILSTDAPRDVITGPGRADRLKEIQGLPAAEMTAGQRRLLLGLLGEYLHNLEHGLAHAQLERMEAAGIERLHFSWAGTEAGKPYYYRIHGPTVLIEFDNSYPPGRESGPVNHIHTVWRDPERDYGEDLLRQHYLESPHHQEGTSGATR